MKNKEHWRRTKILIDLFFLVLLLEHHTITNTKPPNYRTVLLQSASSVSTFKQEEPFKRQHWLEDCYYYISQKACCETKSYCTIKITCFCESEMLQNTDPKLNSILIIT